MLVYRSSKVHIFQGSVYSAGRWENQRAEILPRHSPPIGCLGVRDLLFFYILEPPIAPTLFSMCDEHELAG